MEQLPVFLNLRGRAVALAGTGALAAAKRRLIEDAGGLIGDDGARVGLVASDTPEADAARLKAQGMLVNVADRPDLCDFTLPAIVARGAVTVAIGTGGASATLAKALRERFEALLPDGLGALATAIGAAKPAVAAVHTTPDARRAFWDALLAPGGGLDPLADNGDPAAAIAAALAGGREAASSLTRIAATEPDNLTLRELRALSQADTLFHAPAAPPAILARARRDATRIVTDRPPADLPPGRSVFVAS